MGSTDAEINGFADLVLRAKPPVRSTPCYLSFVYCIPLRLSSGLSCGGGGVGGGAMVMVLVAA